MKNRVRKKKKRGRRSNCAEWILSVDRPIVKKFPETNSLNAEKIQTKCLRFQNSQHVSNADLFKIVLTSIPALIEPLEVSFLTLMNIF